MVKKKRARYDFVQVGGVHMYNLGGVHTVQLGGVYTVPVQLGSVHTIELGSVHTKELGSEVITCAAWQSPHCTMYSIGEYSFALYTLYSSVQLGSENTETAQLQQLQEPLDHEQTQRG
jgi:hypothetical protein